MALKHIIELILLAAIWGASFLFMRVGAPEFGPIPLMFVRTGVAALFLLPIVYMARQHRDMFTHWKAILLVGLVNTAIPFCLFAYATLHLDAGYTSILNATAPIFGALVAFLWLKDRLAKTAIFGLALGFTGVFVLIGGNEDPTHPLSLLPIAACLGATFLYGLAACCIKRYLQGVQPLAIATASLIFSTLALLPFAWLYWPAQSPSHNAWSQAIILGVACTGVAYISYFRLISQVGAAKAITVAYLVPVFGVFWGVTLLDEVLNINVITGALLILTGVALTTGVLKFKRASRLQRQS